MRISSDIASLAGPHLAVDVPQVVSNAIVGYLQLVGDLLVPQAAVESGEDVQLP